MNEQSESLRRASGVARGSNRGRLVEVLRRQGPTARVELARSTGLSFAAISAITSKLMAEELLCEAETDAGAAMSAPDAAGDEDADALSGRRRGRPATLLTLNPEFGRIVAVSLRMNLIETLIADFSGTALAQSRLSLATPALEPEASVLLRPGGCARHDPGGRRFDHQHGLGELGDRPGQYAMLHHGQVD